MAEWGICTTVKAPLIEVEAFVAHHLSLGASQIWLHFDDPDDPAIPAISSVLGVTAVRCDADYWVDNGGKRPPRIEGRQSANIRRVYKSGLLPWVAHIDIDEFIHPVTHVGAALDQIDADDPIVRMRPWEALYAPVTDFPFAPGLFRAPIRPATVPLLFDRLFGDYSPLMERGSLSHAAGKAFYRSGVEGLRPKIHTARLKGRPSTGYPFNDDLRLLHFHAQNKTAWINALPRRLKSGSYGGAPAMADFLAHATADQINAFYDAVMMNNAKWEQSCRKRDLLIEVDLNLPAKVANLRQP